MTTWHQLLADPAVFELTLLAIAVVAGVLGSILGLGGGIVIIPALTLLFGVNIRYAIGASIVSVIATSSGAAATYVKDHITNIRVAMLLEVATTCGALAGALLASMIDSRLLFILFAVILAYSGVVMVRAKKQDSGEASGTPSRLAETLRLNSSYPDAVLGREVAYGVHNVGLGFVLMIGAGLVSGLLGIGSGALKVPAMDQAMGLPIKVSTATSNFMIGVTGAASAGAYFMRGLILPSLAAPVALGVVIGSWIGTRIMLRLPSAQIRRCFVVVLFVISLQMALKGLRIELG